MRSQSTRPAAEAQPGDEADSAVEAAGRPEQKRGPGLAWLPGGMVALLVVCCGLQSLAAGAIGGLAVGSAFGVGAGVVVAVLVVAGLLFMRRRRAARCARPTSLKTGKPSS